MWEEAQFQNLKQQSIQINNINTTWCRRQGCSKPSMKIRQFENDMTLATREGDMQGDVHSQFSNLFFE